MSSRRLTVGSEPRPLVVSASVAWTLIGYWFVEVETMTRDEANARHIGERNAKVTIPCRSEAQAREIRAQLVGVDVNDGPEPGDEVSS